ncbi:DUF1349 domain-containing protein [Halomicrobium urmianum]|uniref:DUF1349 domain-containing protein n=1 Tax=Halomicrobium urmianum TaxID=1586233 RepID=UPI001CD99613|nr:DUF1349 domain-containing protein [Halomicrobium urmianum]
MDWFNEPTEWSEADGVLSFEVEPDTDCWRITDHGFVKDDAHASLRTVEGDFTATAAVRGDYGDQYDQAGLLVRESPATWLKCGVELVDGEQYASAVVTRGESDWSVVPLDGDPPVLWIRVERRDATVEVSYSLDGESFTMIRKATLSDAGELRVGPMGAAPEGDGFTVTVESFSVE